MIDSAVSYELLGPVALITIDDGKANAISHDIAAGVHAALAQAKSEASAVVLAGRPGRFSAGFDLSVMTSSPEAARNLLQAGANLAIEIHEFPMPVVVASTGHALAMGAILLMAADVRIGAEGNFKIGLNEVAIGMPVPKFAVELARTSLSNATFTAAVNHATVYDPAGAVIAGYLDQIVADDAVVSTALAHAADLAERLDPKAFALTRANCRGASLELIRNGLVSDIATFVVNVPKP
ncbi:MAG: crotonase/enoyl-CoA hydratase family protein [Acidimicrobiales bacterium]